MTSSNKVPGLVQQRKYGLAHNPVVAGFRYSYYDRQRLVRSKR
jgi:hypothetical protein